MDRIAEVVRQKLEFLRQPAPHDGIVPIEPQGERLAIENLLVNARVDESLELRLARQPLPLARKNRPHLLDIARRDVDAFARPIDDRIALPAIQSK